MYMLLCLVCHQRWGGNWLPLQHMGCQLQSLLPVSLLFWRMCGTRDYLPQLLFFVVVVEQIDLVMLFFLEVVKNRYFALSWFENVVAPATREGLLDSQSKSCWSFCCCCGRGWRGYFVCRGPGTGVNGGTGVKWGHVITVPYRLLTNATAHTAATTQE